jgi:glucose-1-phosphate thymidylyltransferase
MKGIVLAGGTGSRLWPITWGVSKQLLPIYDKPLIFYPISTLMLAGIREILIITTPQDNSIFKKVLGTGEDFGINFQYEIQEKPNGIAEAFVIGEKFISDDNCALILGDNLFFGGGLGSKLGDLKEVSGSTIFAYRVADPERYGVVEFNSDKKVISIEEKPSTPKSNFAIPGLYFFDNSVIHRAKNTKPSLRGELEITDVIKSYLQDGVLKVSVLERGTAWLDTGTFESMQSASNFIQVIEERQGFKVACLEEIAWRNGWITNSQLHTATLKYGSSPFAKYLSDLTR